MMRALMRTLIHAAAFALAVAIAPAGAQEAASIPASIPTLKRTVTVSDDLVRIGDMIDNAGDAADTPIFRSPDAGTTGSVTLQQVLDAVRPYLHRIDTRNLAEVAVTRTGRLIDVAEIEAHIARTFAGRYGFGQPKDLRVTLDGMVQPITVDSSATTDLTLIGAALDPHSGRFDISFDVLRQLRRCAACPAPDRDRGRDHRNRRAHAGAGARRDRQGRRRRDRTAAQVRGSPANRSPPSARRSCSRCARRCAMAVCCMRTQLMKPELVHRDDNVTLVYEVPGIRHTTRGKALEAGAMGDTINDSNLETKRTVQGIVSGPSRVTVMATTARAEVPPSVASR